MEVSFFDLKKKRNKMERKLALKTLQFIFNFRFIQMKLLQMWYARRVLFMQRFNIQRWKCREKKIVETMHVYSHVFILRLHLKF